MCIRDRISLICAVGNAVGFAGHLFMPPCWLRSPQKTRVFGRWTFLTNQSNAILVCYHALRFAAPAHALARRAYPLAFALGVGLTLLYYGLDHFLPEKIAEDRRWIAKGYAMIPVANHLEHGLALPTALLDAFYGGHAGQCALRDVLVFVGGYTTFYNLFQVANKRLTGAWLYPVFYEAEAAVGPTAWADGGPLAPETLAYCAEHWVLWYAAAYGAPVLSCRIASSVVSSWPGSVSKACTAATTRHAALWTIIYGASMAAVLPAITL